MYVCICKGVTERHIHQAARDGAKTLKDLRRDLGVTLDCGRCAGCANQCLKKACAGGNEAGQYSLVG
ncbi:MAG: hypothetical protein RIR18_1568 [Pseudomonadota bacterium]|jgi:bacterioferritin-associated ferredoxin